MPHLLSPVTGGTGRTGFFPPAFPGFRLLPDEPDAAGKFSHIDVRYFIDPALIFPVKAVVMAFIGVLAFKLFRNKSETE